MSKNLKLHKGVTYGTVQDMKIVIATPLYPPDVAPLAAYVKTLASRLVNSHEITIVLYGKLPEEIPNVSFVPVSKQERLLTRLVHFTQALYTAAKDADVLYVENGASVELPTLLVHIATRKPFILHVGDDGASKNLDTSILRKTLFKILRARAQHTIVNIPPEKPEILPFVPHPEDTLTDYENEWAAHLSEIHNALSV